MTFPEIVQAIIFWGLVIGIQYIPPEMMERPK